MNADPLYFTVMFYGTFILTHGIITIIEAAQLLQIYSDIRFILIGDGPLKARAMKMVAQYGLSNVEFINWIEPSEVAAQVATADICLGVFGTTPQAQITIQNKIYETLAMAKPLLTGDGIAVRRYLIHKQHAYFCEMDNPQSLAESVLYLRSSPALRRRLAENGYSLFISQFSIEVLGNRFRQYLVEMLESKNGSVR
jgi:glycosyltransferase involved in cell wall biosynthesis